jgi:tRNA pseudouridine55 synthase
VGHLAALRRTASGGFRIEEALTLELLEKMDEKARASRLLPLTALLAGLPRAELDPAAETRFRQGQALPYEGPEGLCGVYGRDGVVVGLGRAQAGRLHPARLTSQDAE